MLGQELLGTHMNSGYKVFYWLTAIETMPAFASVAFTFFFVCLCGPLAWRTMPNWASNLFEPWFYNFVALEG
jgi:hypothetical protein